MKLLLTGFDPFGGETMNPALEAVQQFPDRIGGIEITKLVVPTVFGKSIDTVSNVMEKICPDVVLCIGQAGGRNGITVERVAINCSDARIADNEGNQPVDEPIFPDGPAAYFSTLPVKQMVNAMKAEGIPAAISNSAGTFVCNQLLYGVLYTIEKRGLATKAGFIHVPYVPAQAAEKTEMPSSMSLSDMAKGLEAAILVLESQNWTA